MCTTLRGLCRQPPLPSSGTRWLGRTASSCRTNLRLHTSRDRWTSLLGTRSLSHNEGIRWLAKGFTSLGYQRNSPWPISSAPEFMGRQRFADLPVRIEQREITVDGRGQTYGLLIPKAAAESAGYP